MKDFFTTVITSDTFSELFTISLVIASLSWLARKFIESSLSKNLESYKKELEISHYKFQSLHTSRAEVIEKIFQYLVRIEKYFDHVINPNCRNCSKTQPEKEKQLIKTLIEFTNFYDKNELYFPKQTAEKIDAMNTKLWEIWEDWEQKKINESISKDVDEQVQHWKQTWEKVKVDIPKIKKEIKSEFRELIGVEK